MPPGLMPGSGGAGSNFFGFVGKPQQHVAVTRRRSTPASEVAAAKLGDAINQPALVQVLLLFADARRAFLAGRIAARRLRVSPLASR
jgi:hypothetical protein